MALLLLAVFTVAVAQDQKSTERIPHSQIGYINGEYKPYEVLDTRIDNMRYWMKAAELGLTPYNPESTVSLGTYKSSRINANSVLTENSPDVPVTEVNSTQSENSIFVDPLDPDYVLQSNNSVTNPAETVYGANYFLSDDFGLTWEGSIQGAGGDNRGDPATAIGLNGRHYVGFIHDNGGQGVSYSDDATNWTSVLCSTPPGGSYILDKNHLWIDNSPGSPYQGNVYSAWTAFGNENSLDIELVYSSDNGLSYSPHINISENLNAGSHHQGVNITTGPLGQVYAVWTLYDSWPSDESAIGFARSMDGGATWEPAKRIIDNIRGIRLSQTSKLQRVNSFPVATCDIGGNGDIYVVWTNIGVPGINTGEDRDIYMIKSIDEGDTWLEPIRVNQDEPGQGHEHYFPWITCDPETGTLSAVFYDDRNVGGIKCETFCANSYDGGDTWEDFRVSDVDFTPFPIQGLAGGYMGDYLGISARGAQVYPVWTDNRDSVTMTYTSPYTTNTFQRPTNLTATVTFETGEVQLDWQFSDTVTNLLNFNIYRDGFLIGTSTDTTHVDPLPDYGLYKYKVTALLQSGESSATRASVQWGSPHVAANPAEIIENIGLMSTSTRYLAIENTGEMPLFFNVSSYAEPASDNRDYCDASIGYQAYFIQNVKFGDIDNTSDWQDSVANYTDQKTSIMVGASEQIKVENGYPTDGNITRVWVDWNNDYEFDVVGDEAFQLTDVSGGQGITFEGDITVPQGTPVGDHRMRVRLTWSTPNPPCGYTSYGEVEDYTIHVTGWMQVEWISDTIYPGETELIEVTFNSGDLDVGTYYGNIFIETNDPDMPQVDVPVTLNVSEGPPLAIQVVAEPAAVCSGDGSQLMAIPSGGTGSYSYEWTSDPSGFTSTDPEPMVYPEEATTYFVDVHDGVSIISGQTSISISQQPETPGMPMGEVSLCFGEYQTVYSTDGSVGSDTYMWDLVPEGAGLIEDDGLTATVSWDEEFTGMAEISVAGVNDCGDSDKSDVLVVKMNELPDVNLGEDMEICANNTVLLSAGNPGASYLWSTGETTQSIEIDTTGVGLGIAEAWVELTDVENCINSDTILIEFNDCTGISEIAEQWSINIYPNPSNGQFVVELNSKSRQSVQLRIFNAIGSEVYIKNNVVVNGSSSTAINLKEYPEGIYYINLQGNGVNIIKKIVIQ